MHDTEDIAENLRNIRKTIRLYPFSAVFSGLLISVDTLLSESILALDSYCQDGDIARLNKTLVLAAIDFLQRWESWLETRPVFNHASHIFHAFLIRHLKGIVKSWRIWKIDLTK